MPGLVYPAAPAGLGFVATNSTLQTAAQNCVQYGTSCTGLTTGPSSSCTYPSAGSTSGVIAAGYAMWASAPGTCRYAIGVLHSGRNG